MRNKPVFIIVFVSIILFFGISFFFIISGIIKDSNRIEVIGNVTSYSYSHSNTSTDSDGHRTTTYYYKITYEYEYDGQTYKRNGEFSSSSSNQNLTNMTVYVYLNNTTFEFESYAYTDIGGRVMGVVIASSISFVFISIFGIAIFTIRKRNTQALGFSSYNSNHNSSFIDNEPEEIDDDPFINFSKKEKK